MTYNLLMFSEVLDITFFEANLSIRVVLFCMQNQLGLQFRIRDHFLTRFNVTSPFVVLELPNELRLKNLFFEVSSFALFMCHLIYMLLRLCFGN